MSALAEEIETALTIAIPEADNLRLDDDRRLTGPGFLWEKPGAILDVFFEEIDTERLVGVWQKHIRKVLDAVGWTNQQHIERQFAGGVNLAISAPMDQLYSAIFVARTAWHFCASELLVQPPNDFDAMITDLKSLMRREANPALIALIGAGEDHNIDCLCDDDVLSLGHGAGSQTWPIDKLPEPRQINWANLHNIPVALITGTNGKTTTTRLCSAIASASGKVAGLTSTEFVRVGDDILDHGDYSGPGGARMLLRDQRLEIACLEVARGGILRRGLPLRQARVAVVTNVAADHLGQYGVNTVEHLARAKFAVHRALEENGVLVLNADDPLVVAEAKNTDAKFCWFSLDADNPHIVAARASGQICAWQAEKTLYYFDSETVTEIIDVAKIPITMNGAARYNIQNALAAICVSRAMDISDQAIHTGLVGFKNDPKDNPGRCNEFAYNGARVFVDFAHNPHSIAAVCEAMAAVPAKRRFVLLSHAGDRSDQDILDVTNTAFLLNPDFVIAAELEAYLRGRQLGEIPALIKKASLKNGLAENHVLMASSPANGVEQILSRLEPGDLALLLVLSERDAVFDLLAE